MNHARIQIRDAIISRLRDVTSAGTSVYNSRVYAHTGTPSINVAIVRENVADEVMGNKQMRQAVVEIECRVKGNESYADNLDSMAAEVEMALQFDDSLGVGIKHCEYQGFSSSFDGSQDEIVGVLVLDYLVWYLINEADLTVILD